jgi:hypothetical protein
MNTRPKVPSKQRAARWLAELAATLLLACGGQGGAPGCIPSVCMMQGQECNPQTEQCESVCTQLQCAPRTECSGHFGSCVPVDCGQNTTCLAGGSICDIYAHACYPSSGKCSTLADCPQYDGQVRGATSLSCTDGFCHLASQPPPLPGPSGLFRIEVSAPAPGAQLAADSDPQFQWSGGPGATAIALVLTDLPRDLTHVLSLAVWGRVLPATASPTTRWQEGTAIESGVWQASTPAIPPGPLYFLVQGVSDGELLAISTPVAFRVGSAWPMEGDPCADNLRLPGSCASPVGPLLCVSNHCRHLCAAHKDCPSGVLCGAPVGGVRICGG